MTVILAGSLIAGVIVCVLVVLLWDNPVSMTRAERGTRYRVGHTERVVPDLQLTSSPPRLVREPVLERMGRLLEYADAVLTASDIPYWISCGTLLGAMRHQGFIPWDDDIDVQIDLSDRPRLLALRDRFQRDGFVLVDAGGGYKLAYDTFWRFPFIDLTMVARADGRLKLCYPLTAEGACTFGKALQWPNECLRPEDVFPLARIPFEYFSVWAPARTLEAAIAMYGARSLSEVRHKKTFVPWIVNHRTDSLLLRLGLIEG